MEVDSLLGARRRLKQANKKAINIKKLLTLASTNAWVNVSFLKFVGVSWCSSVLPHVCSIASYANFSCLACRQWYFWFNTVDLRPEQAAPPPPAPGNHRVFLGGGTLRGVCASTLTRLSPSDWEGESEHTESGIMWSHLTWWKTMCLRTEGAMSVLWHAIQQNLEAYQEYMLSS